MQEIKRTNLIGSKLITAMLACIICVLVTSRVYAEDTVIATGDCSAYGSSNNVTYTIYDTDGDSKADKLVISGTGEMKSENSLWSDYVTKLKTLVIGEGVTSIGSNAFENCSGLTNVSISNTVKSIGRRAFIGCSKLTSVTIPDSVTSIGEYAFYGCSALTSVTIEDGVQSIGSSAFASCSKLASVSIPGSVTSIGSDAFNGCSVLTSVTIADGVTSIGSRAFKGCSKLTSISIPGSVTSIGESAFEGCSALTNVTIADGVTSIGNYAFQGCSKLTSVSISNTAKSIGSQAFQGCSKLTSVTIPDSVLTIGYSAFGSCSALTSVIIENGVQTIEGDAFYNCSALTSVSIPGSVTSIGYEAFEGCSALTSVIIEDGVTSIGFEAFYGCSKLTSVTIPDSVTSIGNSAFGYLGYYSTVDGFTIKGYPDSTAQTYANKNGFTFIDISSLAYDGDGRLTFYIENASGWKADSTGTEYWYENGYRMGYDAEDASYRGKEIYDPVSNAWFWLDNVDGGKKAVSKDVYQESKADDEGNIGKWVRYDANGYMIKGWDENVNGKYFFDYTYGTMVKGYYTIDGTEYYFNTDTGVLERTVTDGLSGYTGWKNVDGADFWYEDGKRQGTKADPAYRGKEIFDPGSDAWYWLDNVDGGKKAVSKDVYQESQADDAGNIGKWVRYDANGRMIKGWSAGYGADARVIASASDANGEAVYYFDPKYGTMAKGQVTIDGVTYTFDTNNGVLVQ